MFSAKELLKEERKSKRGRVGEIDTIREGEIKIAQEKGKDNIR